MGARQSFPVVLIVEDDALLRIDIVSEFRGRGWPVHEAANGEEAVSIARQNFIDIVITDIQLGGGANGWDVAEAVRGMWPNAAVVYASGNAPDRSRIVRNGVFLDKPYDVAGVVATCARLCR